MSRIEINGIYKHAPLTDAQIAGTKRNLDREIIVKIDSVTPRTSLIPDVTTPATDANAYPTSYIYAMDYDSTDDGGTNSNIRRHIPTLELLGSKGSADDNGGVQGTAGSSWINIETTGAYTSLTGGQTLQAALEALDGAASSAGLKHLIDGTQDGSLISSINGSTASSTITGTGTYNIALGRINTINNTAYSGILNGTNNTIYSTDDNSNSHRYNTIINGSGNYISLTSNGVYNSRALIGTGENNYISNVGNSSILSGTNNYITTNTYSYNSSIITGSDNNITHTSYSLIGAGNDNKIETTASTPTYSNGIFSGDYNYIINGSYSVIGAGYTNYIYATTESIIGAGGNNHILTGSYKSGILSGDGNIIETDSYFSFIGAGNRNYIDNSTYSVISGGGDNKIDSSAQANFIGGGQDNTIENAGITNFIGAGQRNHITDNISGGKPLASSIIGGQNNKIEGNAFTSFIGGGQTNYIINSNTSIIVGGQSNKIEMPNTPNFWNNSILGGGNNEISGMSTGHYSSIVSGYLNKLYQSDYSGILTGNGNYINGNYNVIGGGNENYIHQGSTYSFIGSGSDNYIQSVTSNSFIGSGVNNYIQGTSDYSTIINGTNNNIQSNNGIISGVGNTINTSGDYNNILNGDANNINGSGAYNTILNAGGCTINTSGNYNNILNGGINSIEGLSSYSVIMGGGTNTINTVIQSGILGGGNTLLNTNGSWILGNSNYNDGYSGSIILGSGINLNTIGGINNHTYTRGLTLVNRELRLIDKVPNIGDVPIVESIDGEHAVLTWGSPYGVNVDPTPTSDFSFYYIEVNGSTIIPNTSNDNQYIRINESDDEVAVESNRKFKIGSSKDGYNSSDPNTSLAHIFRTTVPSTPPSMLESTGISIEDGYEYTIGFDIVNLEWNGQYLSDNSPNLTLRFNHNIKVIRDGSNRNIRVGNDVVSPNITGNYFAGSINNVDYTTTDLNDNTTVGVDVNSIRLMTSYNYASDQVNIGWTNLFVHQAYIKKFQGTYSKDASSVDINVDWPVGYNLPPVGLDDIHFWVSDPTTNASLPDVEVSQVEVKAINGNVVTISHASYGALGSATDAPCWVHVNDRNPTLNLYMRLAVAKYKY